MNAGMEFRFKVFASAGLAVLICLLTAYGKDYWLAKPFTQWNEPETTAMLTDSPWSRPVAIPGSYGGVATPRISEPGKLSGSTLPQTQGLGGTQAAKFYVRWYSSLRLRQGLGRMAQLRGGLSEADINRFLQQPVEDYAIAVSAPVMEPFLAATYENFKSKTYLLSRKDNTKKIGLKSYDSPKQRQDNFAVFFFPRTKDGKPTIDPADDEIIFETEIGTTKIRAVFKLSRMLVDGNLDL